MLRLNLQVDKMFPNSFVKGCWCAISLLRLLVAPCAQEPSLTYLRRAASHMLTYQYYNFLPGEKKPRNLNIKYTHLNIFTQGIPVASLVGDTYIYFLLF